MKSFAIKIACVLIISSVSTDAKIFRVPTDIAKIQLAIYAATNGDTIVVESGTYTENINFKGKKIVVTSRYYEAMNTDFITSTIIDGSTPSNSDTASTVLFINGEDSASILQGFTITNGKGTGWQDEHGAGRYVEGGGILSALSSPTIRNNIIIQNEAIRKFSGIASTGGGGIRAGDGAPRILNNIIMSNRGMYGGGIVLNYCSGALVRNNVITLNSVYQAVPSNPTYGGGGIWINNVLSKNGPPNIIENNTIVGNEAVDLGSGQGGGIFVEGASNVIVRNNIIWGNKQLNGNQVAVVGGAFSLTYSCIEDGYAGTGNISQFPSFADSNLILTTNSPCIDAGDPAEQFNDPNTSGTAIFPSRSFARNDMGAYGGPFRTLPGRFSRNAFGFTQSSLTFGQVVPGTSESIYVIVINKGSLPLRIDSARIGMNAGNALTITRVFPFNLKPMMIDSVMLTWSPQTETELIDSVKIFHNDASLTSPQSIQILGSKPFPVLKTTGVTIDFGNVDVNLSMKDTSFYVYNIGKAYDSVYITLNYATVKPEGTLSVTPVAFKIAPNDSQMVTFTFSPQKISKTFLNIFTPAIRFNSQFNSQTPYIEQTMRFKIVGTLYVMNESKIIPQRFALDQNFPNPFNPSTTISFTLPSTGKATLKIFDVFGREVALLVNAELESGVEYKSTFNATGLSSGIYFARLQFGGKQLIKKMILMK